MTVAISENSAKFIEAFTKVRGLGWVVSNRTGNTGIGKTLEDYIGVVENNHDAPDLHGFEIKSQRALSSSYVTLFTKAPSHPKKVNSHLRVAYGTPDKEHPTMKALHTSIFHNHWNTHASGFGFKLECNDEDEKIYLKIKDLKTNQIVQDIIYWDYSVIRKIFATKLINMAFVCADHEVDGEKEKFKFTSCELYLEASFDEFMKLLKNNQIQFDIRIGVYKMGKNMGKTHDHGSGFRIKKESFVKIFKTFVAV